MTAFLSFARAALMTLGLSLAFPAALFAAPEGQRPIPGNGPELFQSLLKMLGITPVTQAELDANDVDFGDTIVVAWGPQLPPGPTPRWLGYAREAIDNGGAVLVASNRFENLRELANHQRAEITGHLLRASNQDEAPQASLVRRLAPPFNQITAGMSGNQPPLERINTLAPSSIHLREPGGVFQVAVAGFEGPGLPFAFAGAGIEGPPYRFLAIADQNVFSNRVLLPKDSINVPFAINVAYFLRGENGENRKRLRCLFLDHGRLVETFDVSLGPPPMPEVPLPIPSWREIQKLIAESGDRMADKLQQQDMLNKGLLGTSPERRERRMAEILQTLLVLAAVWAVVLLLRKVWKARHAYDPLLGASLLTPLMADTLIGRRGEELLRRNNLYELARIEIQDAFHALGAPSGEKLPPVEYPRGRQAEIAKALDELWRAGFGSVPRVITVPRWRELERQLGVVRQAAADGVWRFAAGSSAP